MLRALIVLLAVAVAAAHPSLDEMKAAITASPELFDELALHADGLALHAKRELKDKKGKPGKPPKKNKKGYMKCKKKAPLECDANGELVCGPKPEKKPAKEEAKEEGTK